jgi:hypothetical protein
MRGNRFRELLEQQNSDGGWGEDGSLGSGIENECDRLVIGRQRKNR